METKETCLFPPNDPIFQRYHDTEWGIPVADDRLIFEKICLEGFQSGLSWKTILHKREHFRVQFHQFDINSVANFSNTEINQATTNPSIVRNRRKIVSTVNNAKRALELQCEFGSLAAFLWSYEPQDSDRPATVTQEWLNKNTYSLESQKLSRALKKRGWTFVGPTNMYALMQALGLVNDHVEHCHVRQSIEACRQQFNRPLN